MKFKKYILILFLVIFIGWNRVEAAKVKDTDCFYVSNGLAVQVDSSKNVVYVDRKNWKMINADKEDILNAKKDVTVKFKSYKNFFTDYHGSFTFPKYSGVNKCPEYIAFYIVSLANDNDGMGRYHVYATSNEQLILNFKKELSLISSKDEVYYAANIPNMTRDEYYEQYMTIKYYNGVELQGKEICNPDTDSNCTQEKICDTLLGDKNDPKSIRYILDTILQYVRIIVPILIVLLGSLDLAKAVTSGKEDEMKKAQTTFIKRIIAGVLVFFVPVLVDIIMGLADVVWQGLGYSSCGL